MGDCIRGYRTTLDNSAMRYRREQAAVVSRVTNMLLAGDAVFVSPTGRERGGRFQERFPRTAAAAPSVSHASQTPPLTPQNIDELRGLIDANPLLLAMEFERGSVKTTILHSLLFRMSQAAEQRNFGEAKKIAELIEHVLSRHKNSVDFTKTDSDGNTLFHRIFWYAIKTDDKETSDRFLAIAKTAMENVAGATSFKKILAQKNRHGETFIDNIDFDLNTKMDSLTGSAATERSQRQQSAIALAKPFLAKMGGTAASSASTVFDFREGPHKFSEYLENLIQDPITFEPFENPLTDPVSGATLDRQTWRSLPGASTGTVTHPYTRASVNLSTLESNDYLRGFTNYFKGLARPYADTDPTKDSRDLWTALSDYRSQKVSSTNPNDRTTADCHALLDAFARHYGLGATTSPRPIAAAAAAAAPPQAPSRIIEVEIRSIALALCGQCATYIKDKRGSVKSSEGFASLFRKTSLEPAEEIKVLGVGLLQQALDNWISGSPGALEKLQQLIYVKCCLTGHGEDLITKKLFSGTVSHKTKDMFFAVKTLLDQENPDWQSGIRQHAFLLRNSHGHNYVHHVEPMVDGGHAIYGSNCRGELRVLQVRADGTKLNGCDGKADLWTVGKQMEFHYSSIAEHFSISESKAYGPTKGK